MELNQQKELFSKAYVRAVAAVAGFSIDPLELDFDSIDLQITAASGDGSVYFPELKLQLKCTSRDVIDGDYMRRNALVPRILVVVLVPENLEDWLQQSEAELCMRNCAYWMSLRGQTETQNIANVTVSLPRSNQFTVEALKSMIQRISEGSLP
ncbi:MAG: DUF4365 domain-containing protein [Oscillatoriales cyanobacterium]|nr:MAG: DUF4365 domain-containing protein [Oscillatoriales cyanobacterium]